MIVEDHFPCKTLGSRCVCAVRQRLFWGTHRLELMITLSPWFCSFKEVAIFIAPPFTCIPFLIDRLLLKQGGLNFSIFWQIWLLFCVAIYSMLMLILATITFGANADWKGAKGMHWSHYILDGIAGTTLWPVYLAGTMAFVAMLFRPNNAKRNVLLFFGPVICALISFWYTFAVLYLNFATHNPFFAIVPGATGICYTCLLYTSPSPRD